MPQINKLLGIAHKDDVIQKNRRSAVINKINGAYTSSFKSATELVKREKDPEDRRSNTYYIDKEIAEKLKEYFL